MKWTYSAWKLFTTCQRQYEHRYILKDVPFIQNEAALYGDQVHQAIETALNAEALLPTKFAQYEPYLAPVRAWKGERICEKQMALDKDLNVCDYNDKAHFVRGKADLVVVNGKKARCLDWKTGANTTYADLKQLELMALLIFKHYPEVRRVDGALVFLVVDKVIKATYLRENEASLWLRWMYNVRLMENAIDKNQFPPSPGGLCKRWCPVKSCSYCGE